MTKLGQEIIQGLHEALAYVEGKNMPGIRIVRIETDAIDARSVRKKLKLTQDKMARALGTSTSGYRKWEQGQRIPSGAARTLLKVMDREPAAVLRALAAE